jgi:uncharacterized cofD-like protein/HAD superfamily hydrolase (TIGR01484 family)
MIKVLIFSGGTGSIALQRGLHNAYGDALDVKVLINMYDNGLSTGVVRRVIGGKILGPSDLRKNQMLSHQMRHAGSTLEKILEERFTTTSKEAHEYVRQQIAQVEDVTKRMILMSAVDEYFSWPTALLVDYNDFAIANIVYAGIMAQADFSASSAAAIMARILDIPNNVIINSDENLYLHARTKSGRIIYDEGDIVDWRNADDRIESVFLAQAENSSKGTIPQASKAALDAIAEADLIIYSAGTFWSSLAPTYITQGIPEAVSKSNAAKIVVTNNVIDKDMWGVTSNEMIDMMANLMPLHYSNTTVLVNSNSDLDAVVRNVEDRASMKVVRTNMGSSKTHMPQLLAAECMKIYYNSVYSDVITRANIVVADYDDTLVARGNSATEASARNVKMLKSLAQSNKMHKVAICSGNSIKSINLKDTTIGSTSLTIYADGGLNKYRYEFDGAETTTIDFVGPVNKDSIFNTQEIETIEELLTKLGVNISRIENRNFGVISIKPVDPEYRQVVANAIKMKLAASRLTGITVNCTGRTTIDIMKDSASKKYAITDLLESTDMFKTPSCIVYVGDEIDGNDRDVHAMSSDNLIFIEVHDVHETYAFFKTFCNARGIIQW